MAGKLNATWHKAGIGGRGSDPIRGLAGQWGDYVNARRRGGKRGVSWADVCRLALRLPGVTEGTSYGTPALHVCKRFLARLKEDGETMAIKMGFPERELLLDLDPDAFFLTDHYRPYPALLVRLARVRSRLVPQLLEQAWLFQAPRSLRGPRHPKPTGARDPAHASKPARAPRPPPPKRRSRRKP